ncbi:sugar ABC transporter ATP-binding protein [Labrys sp. ZIDIC5]|uniref:sugar ABC transporter ATP-binding protein n=1 Tax=Labrys sedimenti TaxID=3106036 RepID=UPI002ACA89B5|nr:sugar ABC transporter ATP-binding protein [Labrys sp. ZIDIC5]MDZ5451718.1 sugar ABC transporter ATP-binding protein [Labrys sp. ZIDIC5]
MLATRLEPSDAALEARGISKRFAGVPVLHDVDFSVAAGEVHALVGENGAGKSTLMKIVSGILTEFDGSLFSRGLGLRFTSVREAQAAGIAIIHQELNLIPEMTVAENIFLGREPRIAGLFVDRRGLAHAAGDLLTGFGVSLDPEARVGSLRVGEQQLVEIAKALSLEARVLIMDEPTSALSPSECERLFGIIRKLAASGVAIVYISHRMDEVSLLADRVTVMRDGRRVLTAAMAELTPERIIASMVGRDLSLATPPHTPDRSAEALAVHGLGLRLPQARGGWKRVLRNVSFGLHRGEILGIAGLLGSGRTEILETIFGATTGRREGRILVDGVEVRIDNPRQAIRHGLALVTEDRKATGLLLHSAIRDNVSLPSQPLLRRFGLRDDPLETRLAREAIASLSVRCRSHEQVVAELSGGNQQKVVIGKWLAIGPRILLLDEPTRGIDIGAKKEIYDLIFRLAGQGMAILVVSSELPELLLLSDRVLVMQEGRQAGILERREASEEAIMTLASPRRSAALPEPTGIPPLPPAPNMPSMSRQ